MARSIIRFPCEVCFRDRHVKLIAQSIRTCAAQRACDVLIAWTFSQLVRDAVASAQKDNERMNGRKILIEKKKEEQERLLLQAEKEEEEKRIMQERLSVAAEEERRRLDR